MGVTLVPVDTPQGQLTSVTITDGVAMGETLAGTPVAWHDPLTGLPNRALFLDRLTHALARARRGSGKVAVLFLDLDDFKSVNDSRGHERGDQLLKALAPRLCRSTRPGDTVARFGGDEFVVLLEGLESAGEARMVAQRIANACRSPVRIGDVEHVTTLSVGVAVADDPARTTVMRLLRDADTAMYQAKARGKGHVEVFDQRLRARLDERAALERSLRKAIERDELTIFYQPVMALEDNQILSVEALLRWRHPHRGLLAPAAFMGAAHSSGMILRIGEWVLEQACSQAARWQEHALRPLRVSVNLSRPELARPDLPALLERILTGCGLPPELLELEVTEAMLIRKDDDDGCAERLHELGRLGVRVVVDDFGTGHSSLSDLRALPIDGLKIDRSFVRGLAAGGDGGTIVGAVLSMARALRLDVVAEGVESRRELAALRGRGCGAVQGFLLAPPSPAERVGAMLLAAGPERRLAV